MTVRFSCRCPNTDYLGFEATPEGIIGSAARAEELGFDTVFVNDHMTALIGGILGRATGKLFDVLAAALLFDPLGISDVTWTRLPNGDPKNWCCLWLRPRDMAKIGQLVLDRGRWNGARVVSETWIKAATAPQIKT